MTTRPAQQREPAVALASSQRTWVAELMSFAQDHAGLRVVGTVLSGREAMEHDYDVLLIDDTSSFLTRRLVARVQTKRRIVIGVFAAERGDVGREKLVGMGVDGVIDAAASPKEFLSRIRVAAEQRVVDRYFAEIVAEGNHDPEPAEISDRTGSATVDRAEPAGMVVVVSGTNGTTEISVGIATLMARAGLGAALLDLDTLEPAIAQRVGVDLVPNVLTAIDELRLDVDVASGLPRHPEGFAVLAGLPSPREWEVCSEDELADLIAELTRAYPAVVVRVHRHLEDLSSFGLTAGRFAVSRRVVAPADHRIVVGDPSPTGVTAVLAWIGEARSLSRAPVHVVMNHAARSLYQQGEIIEEIGRTFHSASVTFLPEDQRVRKAAWQGEAIPRGRFARALGRVIAELGSPVVRPRRLTGGAG
jgi:MinD-like ATPase involved in chromosome partitioning or flagellar assembly/DNA-binding NarL/FixJ family response regulator